ncbi:ABC transporter family substrate-binding protein [Nonomuraea jiangxiensis]|uniref:ABC transporter family substrate-binding protein n=1 Tax=Nonomuraea jiangxiensis TaxID=633440 RepID=UPI0015A3CE50|nr:ABC transporter family substrate-binding protein [Nonomuraea jiangxiensis]
MTVLVALALGLTACASTQPTTEQQQQGQTATSAGFAECPKAPATCNGGQRRQGGQLVYALEQQWTNWNIDSAGGNLLYSAQALAVLNPGIFNQTPDAKVQLNTDLMESAELVDPTTIVYKIRKEAVWDDGTPISVKDLEYLWRVTNGKDCDVAKCTPYTQAGFNQIESIDSPDGKTVTVKLTKPFAEWQALWQQSRIYPAHIAEKAVGPLDNEANLVKAVEFFSKTVPTWSGGPYKLQEYKQGDSLVMVPNPRWYGKEKPSLDRLIFKIITDVPQLPTALANREVNAIYPQPQVDMVQQLKQDQNSNFYIGPGLGWEHFDIRTTNEFLKDKALRQALFTAVDRQALIDKTVGQLAPDIKPLNNYNLFEGVSPHYKDVITPTGAGGGDIEKAKSLLTEAGYKVDPDGLVTPDGKKVAPLRLRYTGGNEVRKVICEQFAEMVRPLGVTLKVEPTDDLSGTLGNGDFDVIIFGWTGTIFPFVNARQNWSSDSASNYSRWGTKEIDGLLAKAVETADVAAASDLLNQALEKFAAGYSVLPIYQKPTVIAVNKDVVNVRNNPTGDGPVYNAKEWGLLAQ